MDSFANQLTRQILTKRNPVCVGIDPRWDLMPEAMIANVETRDPAAVAQVMTQYCRELIEIVADRAAVVKPQLAFFEQAGPRGMASLKEVIDFAQQRGLLVVLDGKRNDIGSTASAYAAAYLGRGSLSPWGGDALTVSSYLGEDSLQPFIETAHATSAGIFVLVKTSNPGSGQLQDLIVNGRPIYEQVAGWVNAANQLHFPEDRYGSIGAVTGATHPEQLAHIRQICSTAFLLVPGYGAQGGGASEVAAGFDEDGLGAIINSSRGIINAYRTPRYRDRFGGSQWQEAVSTAMTDMIDDLRAHTPAGRL